MILCSLFGHDYRDIDGEKPPYAVWGRMSVPIKYYCRRCGDSWTL